MIYFASADWLGTPPASAPAITPPFGPTIRL